MTPAIICENLSKHFGSVTALDRINFEVPQGGIFALIGPNGAGKTTLLETTVNLTPPSGGTARVFGTDSSRLGGPEFGALGYVSENQKMPEWMTVGYFLRYLRAFYPTWDQALEASLLQQFDLPVDRKLSELSRGMRVKAALTSSLAYRPTLLVLDEPFSGFDVAARDRLIETLLDLAKEGPTTMLISSHDLTELETLASHVGYLDQGKLRFAEEMDSLTARFRMVEATIDGPDRPRGHWPSEWLQLEISSTLVRFADSQYAVGRTEAQLRRIVPDVRNIAVTPMTLREIFLSMARR